MKKGMGPGKIALIYAVLGAFWVLLSDRATEWLFQNPDSLIFAQSIKGVVYVTLTALLLYSLVRQAGRDSDRARAWYQTLFKMSPDALFVISPEGRFLDVNDIAVRRYGYSRRELLQLGFQDLSTPELREAARQRAGKALEEPSRFEWTHITKEGTHLDVEVSTRPVRADGTRCILSAVRDITAVKQAQTAVQESEAFLRALITCVPLALCSIDEEGLVLSWNKSAEIQLGWSAEEVIGKPLPIVPEEFQEEFADFRRRVASGRSILGKDLTRRRKDGSLFDARLWAAPVHDDSGRLLGIMSALEDISERKRSEERLRASEHRFRSFVENASDIVYSVDPDGIFTYVSPNWFDWLGEPPDKAIGKSFEEYVHPEDAHLCREFLERVLRTGEKQSSVQYRVRHTDGSWRWHTSTGSPLRDSSGKTAYVGIARDVTRERELQTQFRQAQRMEAVGQLTGGVAHDFNNLLQVINGGTELALLDLEPEHPARETLMEVANAGRRGANLVEQLLLFSRRQIMRPEALDLNEVIEDLLKMLRRFLGEHIQLEWLPARHIDPIHADRGMMEQVLMNLCLNARDAMPEGGLLKIETQKVEIDPEYCATHSWAEPGRYMLLTVTDTGCGMDSETLTQIFEPFFTTKDQGKGTGLGLATVYGIVRQHEGLITAESEPGRGSTFRIYLPTSESRADKADSLVEGRPAGGRETILVAEDDESVRRQAVRILKQAGYRVITARDGLEAVELFEEWREEIHFAVLDVVMPKMGGKEAYQEMRKLQPTLKALLLSGYSKDAFQTDFVLDQNLHLLQKPYAPRDLLQQVRRQLDSA